MKRAKRPIIKAAAKVSNEMVLQEIREKMGANNTMRGAANCKAQEQGKKGHLTLLYSCFAITSPKLVLVCDYCVPSGIGQLMHLMDI